MDDTVQMDEDQLDLSELVDQDVAAILGSHNLITTEGTPDRLALADKIEPDLRSALAEVPGDRTKEKMAWADDLTSKVFPDVPGRATWVDQDDPERAEKVFKKLRGEVLRVLSTKPDGVMQSRFASNGGLVLCEYQQAPKGGDRAFYVTRNAKCITDDLGDPARKAVLRANNAYAALMAMAIERVPEHAKKFDSHFKSGQTTIASEPKEKIRGALEAAKGENGADGAEE